MLHFIASVVRSMELVVLGFLYFQVPYEEFLHWRGEYWIVLWIKGLLPILVRQLLREEDRKYPSQICFLRISCLLHFQICIRIRILVFATYVLTLFCESTLCLSVCLLACMRAFVREYVINLFGTLGEGDGFFFFFRK